MPFDVRADYAASFISTGAALGGCSFSMIQLRCLPDGHVKPMLRSKPNWYLPALMKRAWGRRLSISKKVPRIVTEMFITDARDVVDWIVPARTTALDSRHDFGSTAKNQSHQVLNIHA